jgi:hypothetical protein
MSELNLTREEQETIIRGNAASKTWEVLTADPRIARRMERQGYQPDPRKNPWGYVSFTVPFDRIKILKAEKRKLSGIALIKQTEKTKSLSPEMNLADQKD